VFKYSRSLFFPPPWFFISSLFRFISEFSGRSPTQKKKRQHMSENIIQTISNLLVQGKVYTWSHNAQLWSTRAQDKRRLKERQVPGWSMEPRILAHMSRNIAQMVSSLLVQCKVSTWSHSAGLHPREHKIPGGDSRSVECLGCPWSLGFSHR